MAALYMTLTYYNVQYIMLTEHMTGWSNIDRNYLRCYTPLFRVKPCGGILRKRGQCEQGCTARKLYRRGLFCGQIGSDIPRSIWSGIPCCICVAWCFLPVSTWHLSANSTPLMPLKSFDTVAWSVPECWRGYGGAANWIKLTGKSTSLFESKSKLMAAHWSTAMVIRMTFTFLGRPQRRSKRSYAYNKGAMLQCTAYLRVIHTLYMHRALLKIWMWAWAYLLCIDLRKDSSANRCQLLPYF